MGIVRKRQKNHKQISKEDTPSRAPEWIMAIAAALACLIAFAMLLYQMGWV